MDTTYFYFEIPEFYRGKHLPREKVEENKDISTHMQKNDKITNTGEKNGKS